VTFEIATRTGSYDVSFIEGALGDAAAVAPAPATAERILLIADATTAGLFGDLVARAYARTCEVVTFTLSAGEASKSAEALEAIWRFAAAEGLHRGDAIVALGGGVVTDVAGFAAATYHRGIAWIALPTTLLGMIDAAIGGKTAIDLPEGKNLAGAFHPPRHVAADPSALQTLPEREFRTGLAEVIKHSFIATGPLDELLRKEREGILARDAGALATLLPEAARVKVDIVRADETEAGVRAHLNYGHTLAHAIEAVEGYAGRSHGEAVAIGLRFAALLARRLGVSDLVAEHADALDAFGLGAIGSLPDDDRLLGAMRRDKKYDAGLVYVLLTAIGSPVVRSVDEGAVRATLTELRATP
jgi:3-dehydroquinate synthase